jgi:hypothetical protein
MCRWCHGSTGILPVLAAALVRAPALGLSSDLRSALHSSLDRAAHLTYAHGLLRKGPGLCHGASGSAATLLALADCSALSTASRQRYLWHGLHLVLCVAEMDVKGMFERGDREWSLFEGKAGACAAVAAVVVRLEALLGRGRVDSGMRSGMLACADLAIM